MDQPRAKYARMLVVAKPAAKGNQDDELAEQPFAQKFVGEGWSYSLFFGTMIDERCSLFDKKYSTPYEYWYGRDAKNDE